MEKHDLFQKTSLIAKKHGFQLYKYRKKHQLQKGRRGQYSFQVGASGEKHHLEVCWTAGGFILQIFMFPKKRLTPLLEKEGPTGALHKCLDNGWINENLPEWLLHFKQHTMPSADQLVFQIVDNHTSQSRFHFYEYCKRDHIHMLSLSPHMSHKMQPLNGSLKSACNKN